MNHKRRIFKSLYTVILAVAMIAGSSNGVFAADTAPSPDGVHEGYYDVNCGYYNGQVVSGSHQVLSCNNRPLNASYSTWRSCGQSEHTHTDSCYTESVGSSSVGGTTEINIHISSSGSNKKETKTATFSVTDATSVSWTYTYWAIYNDQSGVSGGAVANGSVSLSPSASHSGGSAYKQQKRTGSSGDAARANAKVTTETITFTQPYTGTITVNMSLRVDSRQGTGETATGYFSVSGGSYTHATKVVSCGYTEHTHTSSCYSSGYTSHTHTSSCYTTVDDTYTHYHSGDQYAGTGCYAGGTYHRFPAYFTGSLSLHIQQKSSTRSDATLDVSLCDFSNLPLSELPQGTCSYL